jgi:hypothetical protein
MHALNKVAHTYTVATKVFGNFLLTYYSKTAA